MQAIQRLLATVLLISLSIVTAHAAAPAQPTEDNQWYYLIGGAKSSGRIGTVNTRVTIGGTAKFGLGYSCGKFDPTFSISNLLDDVKQGAEDTYNAMVGAARSAVASLPALVLQRANPGLYDLFQNATIRAEEQFNISYKTCEQMESDIAAGRNPFDGWLNISKQGSWKAQMGSSTRSGEPNIFKAEKAVEASNGDDGVPWVDGENYGGKGQDPIEPVATAAIKGYSYLGGSGGGGVGSSDLPPRIEEVFGSPREAADWITGVVGDQRAQTCQDCTPGSVVGVGLNAEFSDQYGEVKDKIVNLAFSRTPPSKSQLDLVAAPGVAISRGVIEALRKFPESERIAAAEKLASEVSLARAVEKALLGRRILLSGLKQPEIQGYEIANQEVKRAAAEMEAEIDNLLYEHRVRKEVVSNTAMIILDREAARRRSSYVSPVAPQRDPQTLQDGGISP